MRLRNFLERYSFLFLDINKTIYLKYDLLTKNG